MKIVLYIMLVCATIMTSFLITNYIMEFVPKTNRIRKWWVKNMVDEYEDD